MSIKTHDNSGVGYRLVYLAQAGRCFYCSTELPPRPLYEVSGAELKRRDRFGCQCPTTTFGWTRDHFEPKAEGNGLRGNVVLACKRCNVAKDNRAPTQQQRENFEALQVRLQALWDAEAPQRAHDQRTQPALPVDAPPSALTVALENALRQKEDQSAYQRLVAQASGPVPVEK